MTTIRERTSAIALAWGLLLTSTAAEATAFGVGQYALVISQESSETGHSTPIGTGFFRYDAAAVQQQLDDWTAQWDTCRATGADSDCEGLDDRLYVSFPVMSAEFDMLGHTFVDDDIVWTERFGYGETYDYQLQSISMTVEFGHAYDDPYIYFAAVDDVVNLSYEINGNFADCNEGFCNGGDGHGNYDEDFRNFDWTGVPVPAPEPGTLALLALGVAGFLAASGIRPRSSMTAVSSAPMNTMSPA